MVLDRDLPASSSGSGITLLSRLQNGELGNDASVANSASPGARFVALQSQADNLVEDDTNQVTDVFILDRASGDFTRESLDDEGFQIRQPSGVPSISDDGRFLVFQSIGVLASGDGNGAFDIYHRDRSQGRLRRVSLSVDGGDADGDSTDASLSSDGSVVAFASHATNLVEGDTNGASDIFVITRRDRRIQRISRGRDGSQANGASYQPHISSDGRFVTFASGASNLVDGDTNNVDDVFVHEIATGVTVRASLGPDGEEANDRSLTPRICSDGSRVTFSSRATNLASSDLPPGQVYVRDLIRERTRVVSVSNEGVPGNKSIFSPRISPEGRYVAFTANSDNLVEGIDPGVILQVYVHDILERRTVLASESIDGGPADAVSFTASFTRSSQFMTFASNARNLVGEQTNGATQVYLWRNRLKSDPQGN